MRSIRTQLVLWLVGGTLALTGAAAAGLYEFMDEVLEHSLDAALAANADAISALVQVEDDGKPHLHKSDLAASNAVHHEGPFYFQIWRADGSVLARFVPPSTEEESLPNLKNARKRFVDSKLPDGTWARMTALSFLARRDEDETDPARSVTAQPSEHLLLVVAHDRRSIDGPLAILMSGLLLAAVVVTIGILLVVTWAVRRGLRPLADVSALADRIGPESLNVRFPGKDALPAELLPIGLKLNEVLDRLAAAFARERRFSAAVAHELRTPLAELRSACDVALRWPDDADGLSIALSEARDVAMQMSAMVQTLLSLARQQAGVEPAMQIESVNLAAIVSAAWPELPLAAANRQLKIHQNLDDTAIVKTDPMFLMPVLRNLLENAVDYTPPGGDIDIRSGCDTAGSWSLHLVNTCDSLKAADVSRLFEPFWRADSARTGAHHAGLGLTLVQAYCDAMGVAVSAALISPSQFELTLRFPDGAQPPMS